MATYYLHQDNSRYYYWIIKSDKNGETIARSSESYYSKEGAKQSIAWMRANASSASLVDEA